MAEFSPGLEGVLAAKTEISMVDGQNGRLIYRGYVIADLAESMSYEEVAYLLWYGELPNRDQLEKLTRAIAASRSLNTAAAKALDGMADDTSPMDVLRTLVSAQGSTARLRKPDLEQAIAWTAVFPTVLAAFHRKRQKKEIVPPRDDLGQAANYLYMLTGEEPEADKVKALNSYLVLLADHGMNASTFTARVIASTDSDLASCLVGAIAALKGPAHGGAPSVVMDQLEKLLGRDDLDTIGRQMLERRERFMGFGHRVYRTYDPRARILKGMCERLNPDFYKTASKWEEVALQLLQERHPERPQATNVEFYSAGVLQYLGLPKDLFPCTFAVSRAAGWTAHVLEQVADNRLIRPQSEYVGPEPKKPVALAERR
jgi:citrate synthase